VKYIPTTKDSIALTCASIVTLGFFIAGLFGVLDYIIVKVALFLGLAFLFVIALIYMLKNEIKKNRPEDKLQDDSH